MRTLILSLATLTICLSGCGGGDGTPVPPLVDGSGIPVSATATPTAFSGYVGGLGVDDAAEPLDVGNVTPPTSETDEPATG